MTKQNMTTLACLIAAIFLGGCGTVNTTSTRTEPALDEVTDTKVQINDLLTEFFLRCQSVRLYRSQPSGLLESLIVVANDGFTTRTFAWNLTWFDEAGNLINSKTDVWRATSVPAGGTITLTDLAPKPSAVDFTFELRRSNK